MVDKHNTNYIIFNKVINLNHKVKIFIILFIENLQVIKSMEKNIYIIIQNVFNLNLIKLKIILIVINKIKDTTKQYKECQVINKKFLYLDLVSRLCFYQIQINMIKSYRKW